MIFTAYVTGFIIGIILGFSLGMVALARKIVGKLRIDRSDPDGPYMFLEANRPVTDITQHKYVVFEVVESNLLSQ